jgi:hypothetical protein
VSSLTNGIIPEMGTGSGGGSDAGGMMVGCEGSILWFVGSIKVNLRET